MTSLLHAELLKLRTTRTFAGFVALSVITSLLISVLVTILTEPTRGSVLVDVYASDTSSMFILVLAAIGITGEWRHRTITSSLLAAPDRIRFLVAKALAFAAAGVALSLLIAIAVSVSATAILSIRDLPLPGFGELLMQVVRNLGVAATLGALGVALGALLRNQLAAVLAIVIGMFVIEPMLTGFAPGVARFAPLGILPIAAAGLPSEDLGLGDVDMLGVAGANLAMVGWIGALLALSGLLLQRRDLE